MVPVEGDRALSRGQFRVGVHAMLEAVTWMHGRGDREIPLNMGMAVVWEDAGHLLGVLYIRLFFG